MYNLSIYYVQFGPANFSSRYDHFNVRYDWSIFENTQYIYIIYIHINILRIFQKYEGWPRYGSTGTHRRKSWKKNHFYCDIRTMGIKKFQVLLNIETINVYIFIVSTLINPHSPVMTIKLIFLWLPLIFVLADSQWGLPWKLNFFDD